MHKRVTKEKTCTKDRKEGTKKERKKNVQKSEQKKDQCGQKLFSKDGTYWLNYWHNL